MRNSRPASISQTNRLRGPWRGPVAVFTAAVVLYWAAVFLSAQEAAKQEAAAPAKAEAKPATYVGSETCQACHEDLYKAIQKSHALAAACWTAGSLEVRRR